jgi:endonuclease III
LDSGFLKTDDLQGVTASDEVKSKYFMGHQQMDGLESIPATYSANYARDYKSISEETLQILSEFGLPADFLDSDSDSCLSDVPSNDGALDYDAFGRGAMQLPVHGEIFVRPAEGIPRTPSKSAVPADHDVPDFDVPFVMTLRPRPPKVSPYFPKPLFDPDSCLPFPSIDAPTFGLVQEQLAHDPFRLLIATIFLNRTRGGVALPVLFRVFDHFPTIHDMSTADFSKLVSMIHSLGFQNERAQKCINLAKTWLARPPRKGSRYRRLHYPCKMDGKDVGREECIGDDDTRVAWEIAHLPGVGPYSLDSWRIFCRDELRGLAKDWKGNGAASADFVPEWKSVLPQDKELRAYLTWMWLKEGWVWDRHTGERRRASEKMMRAARRGGVALEQEGNFVLQTSPVKKVANGLTTWS